MKEPRTSDKLRLPESRKPSVLDKSTVWAAVGAAEQSIPDHVGAEEKERLERLARERREYLVRTSRGLWLEFRQILRVDNLQQLKSLTRLFLDNNFIERMSGLDSLTHLVWLDLSFNRIQKVEGLESLKKLQVLCLYANQISGLGNLDHLHHLGVLRLGRNRLTSRNDVLYLRRLPALRSLGLADNPLCSEDGWEDYVKALLPNLKYLESLCIKDREAAVARFQGEVFRVEGKEEQERLEQEAKARLQESKQRHREAFVESVQGRVLIQELTLKNATSEFELGRRLIKKDPLATALKMQYEVDMAQVGDQIHTLGLEEADLREQEIASFLKAAAEAQRSTQVLGVEVVEAFMEEKESIFDSFYDLLAEIGGENNKEGLDEISSVQREALDNIRDGFRTRSRETWNELMTHEMVLVTQLEQVLKVFEERLGQMISDFLASIKVLFLQGRNLDIRYFKKLTEIGEEMDGHTYDIPEDRPQGGPTVRAASGAGEEVVNVLTIIARCHDGHQELLMEEEANIQASVRDWAQEFLGEFRVKEQMRNRARVLELNHFLDCMKAEEEELDPFAADHQFLEDR